MIKIEGVNGPITVVEFEDFGRGLVPAGARLVAIADREHIESVSVSEVAAGQSYPTPVTRSLVVKRPLFVMERNADTVLAEAMAAKADLAQREAKASAAHLAAEKELVKVREELERCRAACMSVEKGRDAAVALRVGAEARLHTLERDLAKVRQAVGDLRWREIVDAP